MKLKIIHFKYQTEHMKCLESDAQLLRWKITSIFKIKILSSVYQFNELL